MNFTVHPNVYSTGNIDSLRSSLVDVWIRNHTSGDGTLYIVSGFANFNGGARFYNSFVDHIEAGGRVIVYLGGSTRQRLSSEQVAFALLECGCEVNVINRKRLLHSKLYGTSNSEGQKLIVSSGNFTGPGMSQNIESTITVGTNEVAALGFSWDGMLNSFNQQNWLISQPTLQDRNDPSWNLLYDEDYSFRDTAEVEENDETLILLLGHSDTARIQAFKGGQGSAGTQYFWLSKDSFDFFPPLVIRNNRGWKGTLSALIDIDYVDINETHKCRVTFEADNNLDFRLGTGPLKFTQVASQGDLACLSRIDTDYYRLKIIRQGSAQYDPLQRYAINFIGNRGKRFGYISNERYSMISGVSMDR